MKKELDLEAAAIEATATEDKQRFDFTNKNNQPQIDFLFAYLLTFGHITTLEARNKLFIMSPASRILELKQERNKNIVTRMVKASPTSRKKIGDYVLLPGTYDDEVQHENG